MRSLTKSRTGNIELSTCRQLPFFIFMFRVVFLSSNLPRVESPADGRRERRDEEAAAVSGLKSDHVDVK